MVFFVSDVLLFESSSAQLRSNEDLEEPECSNYYQSSGPSISRVATLLNQQSAQLKEYLKYLCIIIKNSFQKIDLEIYYRVHIHIKIFVP